MNMTRFKDENDASYRHFKLGLNAYLHGIEKAGLSRRENPAQSILLSEMPVFNNFIQLPIHENMATHGDHKAGFKDDLSRRSIGGHPVPELQFPDYDQKTAVGTEKQLGGT